MEFNALNVHYCSIASHLNLWLDSEGVDGWCLLKELFSNYLQFVRGLYWDSFLSSALWGRIPKEHRWYWTGGSRTGKLWWHSPSKKRKKQFLNRCGGDFLTLWWLLCRGNTGDLSHGGLQGYSSRNFETCQPTFSLYFGQQLRPSKLGIYNKDIFELTFKRDEKWFAQWSEQVSTARKVHCSQTLKCSLTKMQNHVVLPKPPTRYVFLRKCINR